MTRILFQSVVGSRAFELHDGTSDTDVRGVYVASPEETIDPFTDVVAPPQPRIEGIDVYFHEFTHFLRLLKSQDLNAWQALCSRKSVIGNQAQARLREIAMGHLLQPAALLDKAEKTAYTMMQQAARQESGKIAVIALRNLSFAQCVAQGVPLYGFNLGNREEALRTLLGKWNATEAHILYNEIKGRHTQLVSVESNEWNRRQALIDYYSYYTS